MALGPVGVLDEEDGLPTPDSVRNNMRRFYNAWERHYGLSISLDVKHSMCPYIEGPLAEKIGLKNIHRDPTFLTIENFVILNEKLWFDDYYDYVHEGYRVDNATLLDTHSCTSARRKEICQAKYKDLVCLVSWKDGEPELKLKFKRRECKGKRRPGLEFPNGKTANAREGMWLHHIQIYNGGRRDTTCPLIQERMMASGNERTVHAYTVPGHRKAGVYFGEEPISFLAELMNGAAEARDAVITWDWDYVDGSPAEYARLTPLWLDVKGVCSDAEMKVPSGQHTFQFTQDPPWTSTIAGEIVTLGGHIHDGGVRTKILKNGQVVCDSVATYEDAAPAPPQGASEHTHGGVGGMDMAHISAMRICNWAGLGSTQVGDEWTVEATYNLTQHSPMMLNGEPADVMGNAMVYIAESEYKDVSRTCCTI